MRALLDSRLLKEVGNLGILFIFGIQKIDRPEPPQANLYTKDGKYNTTYTVCHNTRIDRTPYIRKSKQKQSKAVAVQASRMQPSPNRFGKYPFIARSTAPQYRDQHPIEDCIKAGLTTRKPRGKNRSPE